MEKSKRLAFSAVSIIVAIVAAWYWWHAFQVSPSDVRRLIENLDWRPAPVLLLLIIAHVALSAWRWCVIEVGLGGRRPSFRHAFASGAFAMGLGTFLPAPVMNVACRSLTNKYNGDSGTRGAVSGTIDQLADFAFTAWLAIPAGIALLQGDARVYFWGAPAMVVLGIPGVLALSKAERFLQAFWPVPRKGGLDLFLNRAVLARIYGISALRLLNLTLITLGVHFACGAATVSSLAVSVPLVTIAIAIAMLPGSIGSAEWSFSTSLARQSIGPEAIVTFVLANRLLLTVLPVMLAVAVLLILATTGSRRVRNDEPKVG